MDETPPTTRATLELDIHPQPESETEAPAGALVTPNGERRSFAGWLELASAIEDWRQAEERGRHPNDRSTMT